MRIPNHRGRTLLIISTAAVLLVISRSALAVEGETFAITSVDFDAGVVEITNHGDADVDPNGLVVCSFPDYAPLPEGSSTLAPGESLSVDLSEIGIPVSASDGELALYLSNDFDSSSEIVAYVEWGTSDHRRSSVAQGASVGGESVWDGSFVSVSGATGLVATTEFPSSASAWQVVGSEGADALPSTGLDAGPAAWAVFVALVGAAVLLSTRLRRRSEGPHRAAGG